MAKNNSNRFNEIQPNSEQREEFLIVMEYLQNEAYDEDHASTQVDIREYALKKYGKEIRRDRIGQILIHLEQLSKSNTFQLPFVLKTIQLKKIRKYYVSQRQFSDDEILNIINALKKDRLISDVETKRLTDKILSVVANREKGRELNEIVNKNTKGSRKINQDSSQTYIEFMNAIMYKDRLVFKLKEKSDIHMSGKRHLKFKFYRECFSKEVYGYAYTTYEIDNETLAVIYLDDIRQVLVTKISNLNIIRRTKQWKNVDPQNFIIDDKCQTIDEWLEQYYSGKYGLTRHFVLKVTRNQGGFDFEKFSQDYRTYWKEDLVYKIQNREVKFKYTNSDGNEVEDIIIAEDAVFELNANIHSFKKWYIEKGNFDEVVILEPAYLNDLYLASRIERYAKRLTKYGGRFNYTVVKEMKPEYKELLEEESRRYESQQSAVEKLPENK